MAGSGPVYTPSAAQAAGASYSGRAVQDTVTIINYDTALCTAKHFPFESQCQIMWLTQIAANGGGSLQVRNQYSSALAAGPVIISGHYGVDANGNPIYSIAPAQASGDIPASALLLASLAASTTGSAYQGGTFTSTLDTTNANIGDYVYLGTNGGLALTKPEGEDVKFIQIVAVVQTKATSGVLSGYVMPAQYLAPVIEEEPVLI